MATYTLTAETGGFGWYHSWLLKDGTWDDSKWWADVAAWQANEGINFGFAQTAETGVFTATGQAITEDIVEKAEVGTFSLTGQAANKSIGEAAGNLSLSLVGQDVTEGISEALQAGLFVTQGQDAGKDLSEAVGTGSFAVTGQNITEDIVEKAETGVFTLAGVPIDKQYSERADTGVFGLTGQDIQDSTTLDDFGQYTVTTQGINENIVEKAETGVFSIAGQDAAKNVSKSLDNGYFAWKHSWLLKDGFWNDDAWWADVAAWEPNEGINFGITELAGSGVFLLVGQNITEDIVERAETGIFSLVGIDAIVFKPRYEFDGGITTVTLPDGRNVIAVNDNKNSLSVAGYGPNYLEIDDGNSNEVGLSSTQNRYA